MRLRLNRRLRLTRKALFQVLAVEPRRRDSVSPERLNGVDLGRRPRRKVACHDGDADENRERDRNDERIARLHPE